MPLIPGKADPDASSHKLMQEESADPSKPIDVKVEEAYWPILWS